MSRSISLEGVRKVYKSRLERVTAVKEVTMTVAEGEVLVLLGASGCGKTTLLRCLAGLEMPDAGTIRIGDVIVYSKSRNVMLPPEKRSLGMVFQSYAIWPHMTVYENVAFPMKRAKAPRNKVHESVEDALDKVGCLELANRYGRELSGGQQQRIALARAIVSRPSVLLLDEPLSNLDAGLRDRLRFEIASLARSLGLTLVYVTHDQTEAMTLADRIVVMHGGAIEQIGSPSEVYLRPNSLRIARALGLMNRLDGVFTEWRKEGVALVRAGSSEMLVAFEPEEFGYKIGESVQLCFRPQDAKLEPDLKKANQLHGTVNQIAFTGDATTYVVSAAGASVRLVLPGRSLSHSVGDRISFSVAPADWRIFRNDALFEEQSGQRSTARQLEPGNAV